MEIKEQIAREIFEYDFTGFNPKWAECANKSHWLNLANKIIELFEQANPIQAGEDGLLADEEIQELYDSDDYGDGFALWKEIAIRQKALDGKNFDKELKPIRLDLEEALIYLGEIKVRMAELKQEKAEAVKKVFEFLQKAKVKIGEHTNLNGDIIEEYGVRYQDIKAFKKQTLEEMNK